MSREHVGEAADLAPAHRVRLTGERERPRARPPDPPGGEVAVDDRVDLVGALRGLVHALREAGDGSLRRGEQFKKSLNGGRRKAGRPRRRRGRRRDLARSCERLGEARRMALDEVAVERSGLGEMHEETAEQRRVRAGRDRKEEIGFVAGRGPPGIDDDDLGAAPRARVEHAAEEDRVAPGRVRADEDDEVGLIEILVAAGHRVGSESAPVPGDRRRHAQPRIGVDVA